ncbi:unnamed protein product, partial [Brassica oleracea]
SLLFCCFCLPSPDLSLRFIAQSQPVNKKSLPLASFAENSIF